MYDMLKEFIKPEFVVLIPVLYLIGMGLKRSSAVFDRTIPLVLGAAGVVLCTVYVERHTGRIYGHCAGHTLRRRECVCKSDSKTKR